MHAFKEQLLHGSKICDRFLQYSHRIFIYEKKQINFLLTIYKWVMQKVNLIIKNGLMLK
jgi:hypothetical protein